MHYRQAAPSPLADVTPSDHDPDISLQVCQWTALGARLSISPMAVRIGQGDRPEDVLDLLSLASARPAEAMAKARAVLAAGSAPYDASVDHQAIGTLLREFGDAEAAIRELQAALRLARTSRSPERQADVLATLGVTLTYHGQSQRGIAALDSALALAAGPAAGRVLMRRGIAFWRIGHHPALGCRCVGSEW